ncbi:MAG: hypothetical protein JW828_16795 [Sedimentisphaerales bacterium]|nr:hypothetical protein [Sedimentisphaerales bacterium]
MRSLGQSIHYKMGLLVYGITSMGLLAAGYFGALRPQTQRLESLQQQLSETSQRWTEVRQAKTPQAMQRLQDRLEVIQDRLGEFMVSADSDTSVNFQIGRLANELELRNLTSERKEGFSQKVLDGYKNLGEVWMELNFESDFPKFAEFVNQLERHRPVLFVEKFRIEQKPHKPAVKDVQLTLCFFIESREVALK